MGLIKKDDKCGLCGRKGGIDFGGFVRCDNCVDSQQERTEAEAKLYGRDCAHLYRSKEDKPVERVLHKHAIPELSLEELEVRAAKASEGGTSRHVTHLDCKGCGAQVEIPKEIAIGECLFCGTKASCGEPEPSELPPDQGLIPFTYGHDEAVEAMKQHVKSLWLRPGGIAAKINPQSVRKVYVPFWTFDTDAGTEWKGHAKVWQEAGFIGKLFGRDGRYKKVPTSGSHSQLYNDWLVCASHGVPVKILRQLEPFHTEGLMNASDRESFIETPLERAALGPRAAWTAAQVEIRKNEFTRSMKDARLKSGVEESDISITGRVDFSEPKGKAVVLPLYIFSSDGHQVMVNGETGTAGSDISYSFFKVAPLGMFAAFVALVICILSGGLAIPASIVAMIYYWIRDKRKRMKNEASFLNG